MIKILVLILLPVMSFGQFTIERIAYDSGPGGNDTLWTRDGSNKDTLFRRVAGVFQFGNKPYFRKLWTSVDVMDWDALYGTKLNTNGSAANLTSFPTLNQNTTGTAGGLSANIAQSQVTNLVSDLSGKLATNGSAAALTAFPTLNQNTTGTSAGLSAVLSFANGGISASAATSATTGTMTVNMTTSMITITPTGACTFNASGGVAGQVITFLITTSGTTSFVLTFGTNFRKVGTLATGTTSARFFSVTFICINGTTWQEIARTAAQT